MSTRLPAPEYVRRIETIRDRLSDTAADGATWFGATSIAYLTGFHHIQTERPVLLCVTRESVGIVVPRLEVERVRSNDHIETIEHYFDYPGGEPIRTVVELLGILDVEHVVADSDSAPGTMGYDGPPLSDFVHVETQDWVGDMRRTKSTAEVALIRESCRWGNLGHRYLAELAHVGAHPATVSQRASLEASRAMLDTLGPTYAPRVRGDGPVHAGIISGSQTALPHGHTANRQLGPGDVIITGATANVDGYFSELERTMFVGDASAEDEQYFGLMIEAQSIAIDACGPGVDLADVDRAVWEYFREQGVTDLARHHVGHNIGLEGHEPPYIDRGATGTMEPGHVYTIEPGLYTDEAGYRHSDTVLITKDGTERLTYYPRSLEENIVG